MDTICPACRRQIEIPERHAIAGGQCRCQECWAKLRVMTMRPFRVVVEAQAEAAVAPAHGAAVAEGDDYA